MRDYIFVVLAACSASVQERPPALSPADPSAPESEQPAISLREIPAAIDDKAGYTCPMHPEVVSDKPGRCPKCNMKLVPKQHEHGK